VVCFSKIFAKMKQRLITMIRFTSLIASMLIMLSAGTPHLFATYAVYIKDTMNYTLNEVNMLNTASAVGL
jgi:hypothetical protein